MPSLYYPKAPKNGSFSFSQATLACFGTTQNKTTQNKCDSKSKRGKRLVFLCSLREFESTGVERGTWNSEEREREREKEKWWWGWIKREAMELSVFGDDWYWYIWEAEVEVEVCLHITYSEREASELESFLFLRCFFKFLSFPYFSLNLCPEECEDWGWHIIKTKTKEGH